MMSFLRKHVFPMIPAMAIITTGTMGFAQSQPVAPKSPGFSKLLHNTTQWVSSWRLPGAQERLAHRNLLNVTRQDPRLVQYQSNMLKTHRAELAHDKWSDRIRLVLGSSALVAGFLVPGGPIASSILTGFGGGMLGALAGEKYSQVTSFRRSSDYRLFRQAMTLDNNAPVVGGLSARTLTYFRKQAKKDGEIWLVDSIDETLKKRNPSL